MMAPPLYSLPPEMIRLVLAEIDDPDDLASAIEASSRFDNAFNISPRLTLVEALTKAITPVGLPHALALAHYTSYKDTGRPTSRVEVMDLAAIELPTDIDALMDMWRLHKLVSANVDEYALSAMNEIKQSAYANEVRFEPIYPTATKFKSLSSITAAQRAPISVELSQTERGRLERAFYRLELYCRIHPTWWDPESNIGPETFLQKQVKKRALKRYGLFTEGWQPWETAEMIAVHEALSRKVRKRIWSLNRELAAAVLSVPGVQIVPSQAQSDELPFGMRFLSDLHLQGMYIYSAYSHGLEQSLERLRRVRRGQASELVGKGLMFVAQLVSADVKTFKKLVRVDRPQGYRNIPYEFFLRSQVEYGRRPLANGLRNPIWLNSVVTSEMEGVAAGLDGFRSGTYGARRYYRDILSGFSSVRPNIANSLRLPLMATPFWDAQRMQTPEFITAYKEVHNPKESRNDQIDFAISTFYAERYLTGIAIPVEHLRKIRDEFGNLRPLRSKQTIFNVSQSKHSNTKKV